MMLSSFEKSFPRYLAISVSVFFSQVYLSALKFSFDALLKRRDHYVTEQKKKRKRTMVAITAMCCFCLVALLGFGIRKVGTDNRLPITINDSINIGDKNYIDPGKLDNNKTINNDIQSNDKTDTENGESDKIELTINRVESQISALVNSS